MFQGRLSLFLLRVILAVLAVGERGNRLVFLAQTNKKDITKKLLRDALKPFLKNWMFKKYI